jgi:DNA-binding NarL/FixJ family response regulator
VLVTTGLGVVEARTAAEALAEAAVARPAAVIVDLDDSDTSGYLVCNLLRERYGELLPIVLLSGTRIEASDRTGALLLGADDYVIKPVDPGEVVARLRRLMARAAALSADGNGAAPRTRASDEDFDLTKRERQVMVLLLRGLTQAEISRELVISSNTVATHIQRILLKLGVHNRAQAVAKVARAGWLERELAAENAAPAAELGKAAGA